jgi:peptide/nickel transport system substrate-binding protein
VTYSAPRTAAWALPAILALLAPLPAAAQGSAGRTSIVIATGQESTLPVPTLMEGPYQSLANSDVADQLFARLAQLGPTLITSGDRAFDPLLARSWTRRDSLTLAFDLDPRATWHDGKPVTAKDVVFTFERARNPTIAPNLAKLLRRIASVSAEGERRVVFRYTEAYAEQLYDAVFHVAPLPSHLLAAIPPDSLPRAPFVLAPVGSGPYRWGRRVPGEFVELTANDRFFLGAPAVRRLIFRLATDAEARLNMLLAGDVDASENIPPPRSNLARVAADKDLRIVPVPSPVLGFLIFNQRDPHDRTQPHPILRDRDVRQALGLALDRPLMVRAVFGTAAEVPFGPVSSILWIRHGTPPPAALDLDQARRLLDARGWTDHDGDGIRDRDGHPLSLTLIAPTSSAIRMQMSQMVQEQLRTLGVQLDVQRLEPPVYSERRAAGTFDIDFASTSQDPSPTGLSQGWACEGGTNVGRFCDPTVDSLIERASHAAVGERDTWHAALRRIEEDAPAVFLYSPTFMYAVHRRFTNVRIRPVSAWLGLREWTIGGAASQRPTGY